MKAVTESEMREVLSRFPELQVDGKEVRFRDAEAQRFTIHLQNVEPHQLVFLARLVAALTHDECDFRSAYLWVTQWGVWNPNVEAVGLQTLDCYRRGFGEIRPLHDAPGHLFEQDELVSPVGCLLQPMLVGWDAYYIPRLATGQLEYLIFVSHDSVLDIAVRTNEIRKVVEEVLSKRWVSETRNAASE